MNANENYKDLWDQACEHVAEACALLGVDEKIYPPDTWTLREFARRAKDQLAECDRQYIALQQESRLKMIELNDKRIAAEARAAELEMKLRCATGEHCWATSGGKTECNDCGVLG